MMAGLNAATALNPLQALGDADLLQLVGDVIGFRKRGLFPEQGLEGARGYTGGANRIGAPRTGSPEWNAQYEAQAGLKPGSLEPIASPMGQVVTSRSMWPGPEGQGMSKAQIGQAIRNRTPGYKSEYGPDYTPPPSIMGQTAEGRAILDRMASGTPLNAPKPTDTAQTSYGLGPIPKNFHTDKPADYRMPLAQKQAAEAQTLNRMRDSTAQFEKQWGDWGKAQGFDQAKSVEIARLMRVEAETKGVHISDNQIKFAISLLKQKGQL